MILLQMVFDILLGFSLLWLAWQALASLDLFRAIVLFISFGLLMALVWVRLDAVDVALAEAAIGSGLTGALLLITQAKLEAKNKMKSEFGKNQQTQVLAKSFQLKHNSSQPKPKNVKIRTLFWLLLMMLFFVILAGLVYAVLTLPENTSEMNRLVSESLEITGVSHPVTAVLLNYRGYDTLLEMSVLLLALLGVWSLGGISEQRKLLPDAVLDILSGLLVPLLIIVAGYLLWVGAHAPGGAFQAGSVLAATGVLLLLTSWQLGAWFVGLPLRIALISGLAMFITLGTIFILLGRQFLEYPPPFAGILILLIEAAATLSIGVTLAALFLGGRPEFRRHK